MGVGQKMWTKTEEQYLIQYYDKKPTQILAKEMNRTVESIHRKADRLNLRKNNKWTEEQIKYLKHWYNKKSISQIAKSLNKTYNAVQGKAQKLGLCNAREEVIVPWTNEELDYLERFYEKRGVHHVAKKLKRTEYSVKRKAQDMGLNIYAFDEIYVRQIAAIFNCDSRVVNRWIDKFGLPCRETLRGTSKVKFRSVDAKQFWKWAENHKDIIPFEKYEKYGILPEPEWVNEAIRNVSTKKHRKTITSLEIQHVKYYRSKGKTWEELAKELDRTVESVKHIYRM